MTVWTDVEPEHQSNVGFVEGAGNNNPWTQEIFDNPNVNAAYCLSACSIVPYHHGVRWWADSQCGEKGYAYCPFFLTKARNEGVWQDDHASRGAPCDLLPGDVVLFDWEGNGIADHAETVRAVYEDGTFDTYGYNVGSPQGCRIVRRDRKYLIGRARMEGTFYGAPAAPVDVPQDVPPPSPTPQAWTGRTLEYVKGPRMMNGLDVAWVQQVLVHQGYLPDNGTGPGRSVDGWYGKGTAAAVAKLQRDFTAFFSINPPLRADGAVGPNTGGWMLMVRATQGY